MNYRRTKSGPDRNQRQKLLHDYYLKINEVILKRQHPVSGLLPASTAINAHGDYTDAWVRDNVYSILAVWGLALAYRKADHDQGRTYLLEQSVVKLMRGLLMAMMHQADKVEKFKHHQHPLNALHAKYDTATGNVVVGDDEWGHLQLDATSLFCLMLAQMTASGLRIIFTLDEVDFIQNLVHYIGRAYRTPDYGIWERGNKINHGITELNASSIGMAKAALEALRGLDLFCNEGNSQSVIQVITDEVARTRSTLKAILPRESGSKEVDAALLSIISYPAFAIDDPELVEETRDAVIDKLEGRYGCKRFLLDGHQTVLEETHRLHYEPEELKQFENIESEWPLFFTYLLLDALFEEDEARATHYRKRLNEVAISYSGLELLPELYFVPIGAIDAERKLPHSQQRLPNENIPLVWAQSLFYLGTMIQDGLLDVADIDPLGRRWLQDRKRCSGVQIALIAENKDVQNDLLDQGYMTQTLGQTNPIQVRTAAELAQTLQHLGENKKLGLTGRPLRRLRSLTTSQVFQLGDETLVFLPEFLSQRDFYINYDSTQLVQQLKNEIAYHQRHWDVPGKPLIAVLITASMLHSRNRKNIIAMLETLMSGECEGVAVHIGRLAELVPSSAKRNLGYLDNIGFDQPPQAAETPQSTFLKWDAMKARPLTTEQELLLEQEFTSNALLHRLQTSDNPYFQVKVLSRLIDMHGLNHDTGITHLGHTLSLRNITAELYLHAALNHIWSVVRETSALLEKFDPSLEDAISELVVRQKQIAVGRAHSAEAMIKQPLSNEEILHRIDAYGGADAREKILTQEIVIYLGRLIRTETELFQGLLSLRINHLISLISSQIAKTSHTTPGEAFEILLQLSPSAIYAQLRDTLASTRLDHEQLQRTELMHFSGETGELKNIKFIANNDPKAFGGHDNWLSWRRHRGAIVRQSEEFSCQVWQILSHCKGIYIGDRIERKNRLDSAIQAQMTANEINFALTVDQLLGNIQALEYRQLNIEALTVLTEIFKANDHICIGDDIILDALIGHAVRIAWLEKHPNHEHNYNDEKANAWEAFYLLSPHSVSNALMQAFAYLLVPSQEEAPSPEILNS